MRSSQMKKFLIYITRSSWMDFIGVSNLQWTLPNLESSVKCFWMIEKREEPLWNTFLRKCLVKTKSYSVFTAALSSSLNSITMSKFMEIGKSMKKTRESKSTTSLEDRANTGSKRESNTWDKLVNSTKSASLGLKLAVWSESVAKAAWLIFHNR